MLSQLSNLPLGKTEKTEKRPRCYYLNIAVDQTEFLSLSPPCAIYACLKGIYKKDKHQVICLNSVLTLCNWSCVAHFVWLHQGWKIRFWFFLSFLATYPMCVWGYSILSRTSSLLPPNAEIGNEWRFTVTPICHQGKLLSHRDFSFTNSWRSYICVNCDTM
jgi:hypothetical protein